MANFWHNNGKKARFPKMGMDSQKWEKICTSENHFSRSYAKKIFLSAGNRIATYIGRRTSHEHL